MKQHLNIKIIAFVGLIGSGKTTATSFLTELDYPKVHVYPDTNNYEEKLVSEIDHLIAAGQHRIILDDVVSWKAYTRLLHEYPTALRTIALFTPRHMRYHFVATRLDNPITETEASKKDWHALENNIGGPIATAQFVIHNDGSLDDLKRKVLAITKEAGFTR
jgi:dephospho-CoA kinase